MPRPNPQRDHLVALPPQNVLVVAPAGCGKTEAIALRAKGLLEREEVKAPRKILCVTFSNKARDNVKSRMRKVVGALWYRRLDVMNLHQLGARIIRAYGPAVGIEALEVRDEAWRRKTLRDLGVTYQSSDAFERALRQAKEEPIDDDEVMRLLNGSGNQTAVEYENALRAVRRVDYDDLLRNAARVLSSDRVAAMYQNHFGVVCVDEVQDLSMLQFEIVRRVGGNTVTYAGDLAQGVYSFAGATPDRVFAAIREMAPELVEFNLSYRSAPAIIRAVNVLSRKMGAIELECAEPEEWPDEGQVAYLESPDTELEAEAIVNKVREIMQANAKATVGVITRRGPRLNHLRQAASGAGILFEDWSLPTHSPQVVDLLRRHVRAADARGADEEQKLRLLEEACLEALERTDIDTAREVSSACLLIRDALDGGQTVIQAVGDVRAQSSTTAPVGQGMHLLSAHKGKGQEFDWVFVVGLEEGHIPDFRNADDPEELRILHVMVSRAAYGLILTRSRTVWTRAGWRQTEPSRWLTDLRAAVTVEDIR